MQNMPEFTLRRPGVCVRALMIALISLNLKQVFWLDFDRLAFSCNASFLTCGYSHERMKRHARGVSQNQAHIRERDPKLP